VVKILGDAAVIHHIEESTRLRYDQRVYQCWAFSKDPSLIPQVVFLTPLQHGIETYGDAQVHFVRPRGAMNAHVLNILIHVDVVEDLLFYHYPHEDLLADGKVPWRDFVWQFGRPDGDNDDDEIPPPTHFYGNPTVQRRYHRDDEDDDGNRERPRARGIMHRMSSWIEGRGRSRSRAPHACHGSGWFTGDSSRNRSPRQRNLSSPPSCDDLSLEEQRAIKELWNARAVEQTPHRSLDTSDQIPQDDNRPSDAIVIFLQRIDVVEPTFVPAWKTRLDNSDAIVINPVNKLTDLAQKVVSEHSEPDALAIGLSLLGSHHPFSANVHPAQVPPQGDAVNATSQTGSVEDMDLSISPRVIDQAIHEQGKELYELLSLFK
jgi:hypothetical protein